LIIAHSDLGSAFSFGPRTLSKLNPPGQILVGLAAASTIGVAYQFKRAIDQNDNAIVP
jgi:hypothetical protein